ncbi:hypothetical protein MOO45_00475 [Bombilactobacillus folatiphilus]|uniref:Uncharacterized protein n=1 Tax=Bombilactobacillus folatiphilus TaxID=2923362 RepID=A0ABY4P8Z3_9LACO|nr:hypothetical protein [Bombilactobacillus folatiphilus]UQS82204.1 hypothetical protein MOO45_00475 [Bombilactobacillus folatiphilus]
MQAKKTTSLTITPTLIDDGFNTPEYTQQEQAVPTGFTDIVAKLQLANGFSCGVKMNEKQTLDTNNEYYYDNLFRLLHTQTSGQEFDLELNYDLLAVDDNLSNHSSMLEGKHYVGESSLHDATHDAAMGKYYVIKDKVGQIKAIKWVNYSTTNNYTGGNIPNNAFVVEKLITPSKSSTSGVDVQLFVKNISKATYGYGVDFDTDDHYYGVDSSSAAKALGDNQGFTTLLGDNNNLNLTVRTKVSDGPNRYFAGHLGKINDLFQGSTFSNCVGQEAENYSVGTVLDSGNVMKSFYLLWPWKSIAPQETQHYNTEIELETAGQAKPVLTQNYSNSRSSRFNYQGDKLNLQVKLVNNNDSRGSLTPTTFYVNLPQGLSVTKADLEQIYSEGTVAESAEYDANTGQVKIISNGSYLSNPNDSISINIPVTVSNDAPMGDATIKTNFSGENKDATGAHQTVTADSADLKVPITPSYDAKLTSEVKNTRYSSVYASSAQYVPGDTLTYHAQYQLNSDNEYALKAPVTFGNSNSGLDFSDSAPSVTVNGDSSVASASVDPVTGRITVTKTSGNFSPGDLLDLTYNVKAKADPVAGEPGANHESTITAPYNTVSVSGTRSDGQAIPSASSGTTLQRKDLDYFVRVPEVIDFGHNPCVFDSPFYSTTSGRLKFSHYSASGSGQYYIQMKYNQDLRTSAYAYLRPDSGNALIEYRPNDYGSYQSIDGIAGNLSTSGFTTQGISDLTSYVSDKHFRLNSNDKPLGNYSGTMTWTYSNSL